MWCVFLRKTIDRQVLGVALVFGDHKTDEQGSSLLNISRFFSLYTFVVVVVVVLLLLLLFVVVDVFVVIVAAVLVVVVVFVVVVNIVIAVVVVGMHIFVSRCPFQV